MCFYFYIVKYFSLRQFFSHLYQIIQVNIKHTLSPAERSLDSTLAGVLSADTMKYQGPKKNIQTWKQEWKIMGRS